MDFSEVSLCVVFGYDVQTVGGAWNHPSAEGWAGMEREGKSEWSYASFASFPFFLPFFFFFFFIFFKYLLPKYNNLHPE